MSSQYAMNVAQKMFTERLTRIGAKRTKIGQKFKVLSFIVLNVAMSQSMLARSFINA